MLNFDYWTPSITTPLDAQIALCRVVGEFADLESAKKVIDIGSGFCAPVMLWKSMYNNLDISCVDINLKQLTAALQKITLPTTTIAKSAGQDALLQIYGTQGALTKAFPTNQ